MSEDKETQTEVVEKVPVTEKMVTMNGKVVYVYSPESRREYNRRYYLKKKAEREKTKKPKESKYLGKVVMINGEKYIKLK